MEQMLLNEAELLTQVCRILDKNSEVFAETPERSGQILQVEGMLIDFAARCVQVDGLTIDFEAGDVPAWEKNIYASAHEYETLTQPAVYLGVIVVHKGLLVRISGEDLEIPMLLYVSTIAEREEYHDPFDRR